MAWSAITDAEIDPESPGTTGLFGKYRDNQEALYDGWEMKVKPGNEVDAGGALQDDDDLFLTVAVNQIWHVEIMLLWSTVGNIQFDFTFPVGTTYMMTHNAHSGNAVLLSGWTTEVSAATVVLFGGVASEPMFMHGWVETAAAAGTFQLQWARSGAGNATLNAGSYLRAHQDYSTI